MNQWKAPNRTFGIIIVFWQRRCQSLSTREETEFIKFVEAEEFKQ